MYFCYELNTLHINFKFLVCCIFCQQLGFNLDFIPKAALIFGNVWHVFLSLGPRETAEFSS